MKKKTLVIFTLAAVAAAAFTGVGCSTPGNGEDAGNDTCTHSYAYNSDSAQHWEECGLCHAKINYADHVDALNNETKESGADGKCDVCGYEVADPNPDEPDPDNPDPDNPDPDNPDPDNPDPDNPDPDNPDPDNPDPDNPDPDNPDPDNPDPDNPNPDDPYDDGSVGSRSNPCALNLNAPNLIACEAGQKLYYSFTPSADGIYTIALFMGLTSQMCTFTTDLDYDVNYGYGCENAKKYVELKAGATVNIVLLGAENLPAEASVSVTVSEYDGEELPEEWSTVEGQYYDVTSGATLTFNQNGTLAYNSTTCNYKYYAAGKNAVKFTCSGEIYWLSLNNGALTLTLDGVSSDFVKRVVVSLDKLTGVYSSTSSDAALAELCIYESGNGYYKSSGSSSNITCKIGTTASFSANTCTLTYGGYTITVKDVDEDGNVTSLWVKASGGGTGAAARVNEYKRTGDAGLEVPEKLPLPNNIELKGETMSIVCNNGAQKWDGGSYQVMVKDVTYINDLLVYTVTNNSKPVYLSISGEDENTVVTVYSSIGGGVIDTLTVKTSEIGVLKTGETANVFTPDDFTNMFVYLTVPESGVYQFSSTDKYLYIYVNYDMDTNKGSAGFDFSAKSTSDKYVLEADSVIAVNVGNYGRNIPATISFTATVVEPDPGTTPDNAIQLTAGETSTISNTNNSTYYYAEFEAKEDGEYRITCQGRVWGRPDYNIHFTVDGVVSGYVPDGFYYGYYYRNGEQIGDKYCGEIPYATVTLKAGEKVCLVLDQMSTNGSGDLDITVEKV